MCVFLSYLILDIALWTKLTCGELALIFFFLHLSAILLIHLYSMNKPDQIRVMHNLKKRTIVP